MIDKGATTIWELWNGDTADPAMNSGNHVMLLGDLLTWYYENLAGIKSDPAAPGFKHVVMAPYFPDGLDWADAATESPYGPIASRWSRDGQGLVVESGDTRQLDGQRPDSGFVGRAGDRGRQAALPRIRPSSR